MLTPQRPLAASLSAVVATVAAGLLAGCAAAPEAPETWSIPVPEGTPIIKHEIPADIARDHTIERVEDFVILDSAENPKYGFYRITDVKLDAAGNYFVADSGNGQIFKLDGEGNLLGTFGAPGQGPGEFQRLNDIAILGDRLVAFDAGGRRFSVWSLDGEYREDIPSTIGMGSISIFGGLPDGRLIVSYSRLANQNDIGSMRRVYATTALDDDEPAELFDAPATVASSRRGPDGIPVGMPGVRPGFTVAPQGTMYMTIGDEYQVVAMQPDGTVKWALWVPFARRPYSDAEIDRSLERVRRSMPDASLRELMIADYAPSISGIHADGAGNVWVIHRTPPDFDREPGTLVPQPVDVFSPQGEHVFSGLIRPSPWRLAHGEHVYSWGVDAETGDPKIVRFRIEIPAR